MLSEVTNFVNNAELHKQLGVSLAIVPVVTGTPYRGLDILWTKWLTPVALPVPSMDSNGALHLVADVMQRTEAFASWRDEVLAALASSKEAEYVMMSTGYRPRPLEMLATSAAAQAVEDLPVMGVTGSLRAINWQSAADTLSGSVPDASDPTQARMVARAALLRVPVRFGVSMDQWMMSPYERALCAAEARGEVELAEVTDVQAVPARASPDAFRLVRLPLLQLLKWGGKGFLPALAYEVGRIPWADVEHELYVAHLLALRLAYWADEIESSAQPMSVNVGDLFPGLRGAAATLTTSCVPDGRCDVYKEQKKFLVGQLSRPEKQEVVQAEHYLTGRVGPHQLTDGVFMTYLCNFLIDVRTSLPLVGKGVPKVHFFVQAKQTRVNKTLSLHYIKTFVNAGRKATKKWATAGDRVIFVLVCTKAPTKGVRESMASGKLFEMFSDLLVITKDEIDQLLPPDLFVRAV
eukprot:contig_15281_g3655